MPVVIPKDTPKELKELLEEIKKAHDEVLPMIEELDDVHFIATFIALMESKHTREDGLGVLHFHEKDGLVN